jgi:CubicO group peptidase (beta-lactamase class C family)
MYMQVRDFLIVLIFFHFTMLTQGGSDEFPLLHQLKTPITIRHLMTHTSGISYGIFDDHPCDRILKSKSPDYVNWFQNTTSSDLCEIIAATPLCFQPGEKFLYGLNIDVLGRIIEIVSGCTLDEFLRVNIFEPLGMIDTNFFVAKKDLNRLAKCYEVDRKTGGFKTKEDDRRFVPKFLSGGGK